MSSHQVGIGLWCSDPAVSTFSHVEQFYFHLFVCLFILYVYALAHVCPGVRVEVGGRLTGPRD